MRRERKKRRQYGKKDTMKAFEEKLKAHISMKKNTKRYLERNSELDKIDEHK